MGKSVRILMLAAGVGALNAGEARALDVAGHTVNYCLNIGGMNACASAVITVSGSTLTAVVRNISGMTGDLVIGRLTQFGFFYLDADPTTGTATLNAEDLPTVWGALTSTDHLATSLNATPWIGHVGSFIGGAKAGVEWADHSLGTGLFGTFTFTLAGGTDWSKVHFGWLGRDLDGGVYSAKCYEGAPPGRTLAPGECRAISTTIPPVSVPEPASMTLIALGMVAMTGATALRRRRAAK